jgi:outer membrane immunogenic protein
MKKLLLATVVAIAAAGSAGAADLPMKAAPMAAPVTYNWTGCYLGAGGGYGLWRQDVTAEFIPSLVAASTTTTVGGSGWFGTGQVGCDYQFNSAFVIGAFADGDWGNIHGTVTPFSGIVPLGGDESQTHAWSVGGRIGYLPFPKLLTFVSGGWTQAHFDSFNLTSTLAGVPLPAGFAVTVPSQDYNGWFIGGGYEYGLDFLPGLFWKTEYRYSSYRAEDLQVFVNGVATGEGFNSKKAEQVIRTELVWRFNFGGPVVARY